MADELDFDLDVEEQKENRVSTRIKALSDKVETTAKERDEFAKAKEEADEARLKAEKERDFYANFTDSVAQRPQASEYKDAIKEKVFAGYTVEDATVSVLAKEGKLTVEAQPRQAPIGGSANTSIPDGATKSVDEMSTDDKLKALFEAEKRGEIGFS
jgi:outer membrane murein-binding lipoprotein Lpp